ncbi:MAG: phosphoribosylaminoimidazolesuccinocarboxamide synthase [Limnohabitans sp.]|nr:phosphoribosylaminoimidazolesuccinocarboxamide synthase [Limnohabitans sp.]
MSSALHTFTLESLPLLARGKVRDNYAVGNDRILMVASDRISAFDVIMSEPIPGKGALLTQMALFWFDQLGDLCLNHLTRQLPESVVLADEHQWIKQRAILVKRLKPIPVEGVVRGYLAGSGWSEYQHTQSVCGVALPSGLRNASRLPHSIFTPAAKGAMGEHDENITFAQVEQIVGASLATQIRDLSIRLYERARDIALTKGIIIADTKFEFGLDDNNQLVLMDEVLTPDSSRYWPADLYREGANPPSFDKQYLRDWLESAQVNGKPWNKSAPAPILLSEVIAQISAKYLEAWNRLKA